MTIYALLGIVFVVFGFITLVLTLTIVTSKKAVMHDQIKGERDALDQLTTADAKTQYELQNMTLEELRQKAKEPW